MSTFRQIRDAAERHRPTGTMMLDPVAYAAEYARRPTEPVAIGVRLLSETDVQAARVGASVTAADMFPGSEGSVEATEAYNDALLRQIVARAATDPNDARQPFFPGDEEEVRDALTSDGCRAIFDELERIAIECSPLAPEAGEDDIAALPELWKRNIGMVVGPSQRRLRRLLGHVMQALLDAESDGEVSGYEDR